MFRPHPHGNLAAHAPGLPAPQPGLAPSCAREAFASLSRGAAAGLILCGMAVELAKRLSQAAGWDVMEPGPGLPATGRGAQLVLGATAPARSRAGGEMSFRASMIIEGFVDIENLCTCRDAREWGKSSPTAWPSGCTG